MLLLEQDTLSTIALLASGRFWPMRRPASPMGQAGRMEATLQKMGIGGCGLAAPPIGEDEPALVARALLIVLWIVARFGEKG